MRRNWTIALVIIPLAVLFARPLSARFGTSSKLAAQQGLPFPVILRFPSGIFAKVNISSEITDQQNLNPKITIKELNVYFISLYDGLLQNQAASGLALQVHWDTVNPHSPDDAVPYFWDYVDDAFNEVASWNQNRGLGVAPKTIQLIVSPGFQSPDWVLEHLRSCDGLFYSPSVAPPEDCGKATFHMDVEEQDHKELPLPWNHFYQSAWQAFLVQLNNRYGSNGNLVSISVAGPTAASEEMIVPNNANCKDQIQFKPNGTDSIKADRMWLLLLAFHYPNKPAYQNSDQAFIDAWDEAIDTYGQIFQGLTLIATTGSGLPNFVKSDFPPPTGFADACLKQNMDCAAETTILSYFIQSTVGGNNYKATQTSGLEALRGTQHHDLGLTSVEILSSDASISPRILGGAQFNTDVTHQPEKEGNASTPEQALFNVLQVYFAGTPAAHFYCEAAGTIPLNYLQIYATDFVYAANPANGKVPVTEGTCGSEMISAQQELNRASARLLSIAQP
jgi:hypothetical protein